MARHPYFEALTFPFRRPESQTFLDAITSSYDDKDSITDLYQRAGGQLRLLRLDVSAVVLWNQVLSILTKQGKLRDLCELLLTRGEAFATGAATQAIIDAGAPAPEPDVEDLLPRSPAKTQKGALRFLVNHAIELGGLTLLVSPYAGFDIDGVGHPRCLARSLLEKSLNKLREDFASDEGETTREIDFNSGLLSNLLVATVSGRAMSTSYDTVWSRMCEIASSEQSRSRIYPILADLAQSWQIAMGDRRSELKWHGVLFVSFDMSDFLERELEDLGISFGVLNMMWDGGFRYHVNNGRDLDKLRFDLKWPKNSAIRVPLESGSTSADGDAAGFLPKESVVVVKLMGLAQMPEFRPLLGFETLNLPGEAASLPITLKTHIDSAPLVMLGAGLFDPLVALAFETHLRSRSAKNRWIICHPSTADDDMLRIAEFEINRIAPEWTEDVFDMKLLVQDLPTIISDISARILDAVRSQAAA